MNQEHDIVTLSVAAHIGYVSYELSLNDTSNHNEVNINVGNDKAGFCMLNSAKFVG